MTASAIRKMSSRGRTAGTRAWLHDLVPRRADDNRQQCGRSEHACTSWALRQRSTASSSSGWFAGKSPSEPTPNEKLSDPYVCLSPCGDAAGNMSASLGLPQEANSFPNLRRLAGALAKIHLRVRVRGPVSYDSQVNEWHAAAGRVAPRHGDGSNLDINTRLGKRRRAGEMRDSIRLRSVPTSPENSPVRAFQLGACDGTGPIERSRVSHIAGRGTDSMPHSAGVNRDGMPWMDERS